jgi:glycosyltransferase involved in cell wall biosynthesis
LDVAALTSHDEGPPVALLEALAAGGPVAGRAGGGVAEGRGDGRLGELVREADPGAMAAAIRRAAERSVPDEVRDEVVLRFSTERLCADMAALYREEMQRAGLDVPA